MKVLRKILIGDGRNLALVGVAFLLDLGLSAGGHDTAAAFLVPVLLLAGVGWAAGR